MGYIIIRMPDGSYAKIPAERAPDPPPPPPPPPPPTGDWVTRPEFEEEVSRLQQTDQELQEQIDQLKEDREVLDHRIDEIVEQVGSITDQIQDIVGDVSGDVIDRVQVLEDKRLIIAIRETTTAPVTGVTYQARYKGGKIQPGYLTVLNADGSKPAFTPDGTPVHGSISENGVITLNHPPNAPVTFVFSAEVSFLEMPRDAFQQHFVTELERKTQLILDVDRIDRELEIQEITPSALSATSIGDNVYLTFAYKDSPKLSHFIIEVHDPVTGQWVPYDGASGVVTK